MAPEALAAVRSKIQWLPDPGPWRYLADPFGIRRAGSLHIFVEAFDYRTKHAVIDRHELGANGEWQGAETVLSQPYHLSYPYLVEADGEVFMVPESHRAGEVVLYRARRFPSDWVRETVLLANVPAAEASLIRHWGRWHMFFTVVGPRSRDQRELHIAHSDKLTGPWKLHPQNPVLDDRRGARPGGTPFVGGDGNLILPVQDCGATYGGGIRFLKFTRLDEAVVTCEHLSGRLGGDLVSDTHIDGLHTLSMGMDVTFIDAKRIVRSPARHWINVQRRLRRLWR